MRPQIKPSRGFIVLEGPDYSGKTTVAMELEKELVKICAEAEVPYDSAYDPGCTPIAKKIRAMVKDPDADLPARAHWLLFQAARIDLQEKRVRPVVDQNGIMLMQRWTDSTRVYQGHLQGISQQDLDAVFYATQTMAPHLVIVLQPSDEEAERRFQASERTEKDYFEKDAFRRKVRDGYKGLPTKWRNGTGQLYCSPGYHSHGTAGSMYCSRTVREVVNADLPLAQVVTKCLELIVRETKIDIPWNDV